MREFRFEHTRAALALVAALAALGACTSLASASWQPYGERDGLTNNRVSITFADKLGNLWLVTDAPGVSRYDGVSWHYYRAATGLPADTITAIVEKQDGGLWFGTPRGVSLYDGKSWGPVIQPGGLLSTEVLTLMEDHAGNLWAGTPLGASRYDGTTWTAITKAHGLANFDVTAIVEDKRGSIWFGAAEDGISRYDGTSITIYGYGGQYMALDSLGNVWVSSYNSHGPARFDGSTWRGFTVSDGLAGAIFFGPLFVDRSGNVWLSEFGHAVTRFDGQHWRNFSTLDPAARDGLPAVNVLAMTQDIDGNLWMGTQTEGVVRFDGSAWRVYSFSSVGLICYDCGLRDHLGNLWYASVGKIHRYDGFGWQTWPDPTGMSYNPVYDAIELASGKLWFGTFLGVLEVDPVTGSAASTGSFDNVAVTALNQDNAGTIWVGTVGGIYASDGAGGFQHYTASSTGGALPSDYILGITSDRTGRIWLSSFGSIARWDPPVWSFEIANAPGIAGQYSVGENSSLKFDAQGNPHVAYLDSRNGQDIIDDLRYASKSGGTWTSDTVQAVGHVGRFTSLAFDPQGNPGISYYDFGQGLLRYASRIGGAWTSETVDSAGFGGRTTSLAFDAQGNPHIAYSGRPNSDLKYASKSGGVWAIETADAGFVGVSSSLAIDALGNPHISYLEQYPGRLKYASKGAGVWTIEFADPYVNANSITSLALDPQGNPMIAYFDVLQGVLRYATNRAGQWYSAVVDAGPNVGMSASMAVDANGHAFITYLDAANNRLKLANNSGGRWAIEAVYVTNNGSLALDAQGAPHVSYYKNLNGNGDLGIANRTGGSWTTVRRQTQHWEGASAVLTDHLGRLWFATRDTLLRYDGANWTAIIPDGGSFASSSGAAGFAVRAMFEDSDANIWVGTEARGAMRFDGQSWGSYTAVDGIQSSEVGGILQDPTGTIWLEGLGVLSGVDPDRRPPRPVVTLAPGAVSANRSPTVAFGAAWAETYGILFSLSFDGGPWSPWSPTNLWSASNLADGTYQLGIRTRDKIGNVSATPATVTFEIDATPPAPQVAFPASRQVVKDSIAILGVADDRRFKEFRLELRLVGGTTWTLLRKSPTPVASGTLYGWNTATVTDGDYEIRLTVADTLGLSASASVTMTIDNQFPSASLTVPVLVRESEGGDAYTSSGDTHLYFPPHAFAQDAVVTLQATSRDSVPAVLPSGATRVMDGYELSWAATLDRPARLDIDIAGLTAPAASLALYSSSDGGAWTRLGGTLDAGSRRLALAVTRPGRYAVFSETSVISGSGRLSSVVFTPRVFSPSGHFADTHVGISFTLGRAAPVTVRVYSVSGRLIREVASARSMGPGQNMVQWDGRDREGGIVTDGMYLVSVEALGQIEKKPLAVVK